MRGLHVSRDRLDLLAQELGRPCGFSPFLLFVFMLCSFSGDTTPCKVTPVILHRVASPESHFGHPTGGHRVLCRYAIDWTCWLNSSGDPAVSPPPYTHVYIYIHIFIYVYMYIDMYIYYICMYIYVYA